MHYFTKNSSTLPSPKIVLDHATITPLRERYPHHLYSL
jgi:hypothetical protein